MIFELFRTKWVVPLLSCAGAGVAMFLYLSARTIIGVDEIFTFIAPTTLAAGALVAIPFTKKRGIYYRLQAFGIVCYLLTMFGASGLLSVQLILLLVFLTELILFEPYPLNLLWTIGLSLAATALRVLATCYDVAHPQPLAEYIVPFVLPAIFLAVFGSLMTKHREMVVDLTANCKQLTESVVNLARANTAYQDYAVDARARATELERLRITRDIHDIVGYTLTNNMMLMEAALDIMKENALALPGIIETARQNAEEGLEQVRSAMYKLREQGSSLPIGLNAISRLARIFEQATSIRIKCDFANMPLTISDEIDSVVYHLVQEALVNSFRHGRATEVRVYFWYSSSTVDVRVRDNGMGAVQITEGIGLRGMRERIETIGGTVRTCTVEDGFLVDASIPHNKDTRDEGQNTNPDR